MYSTAVLANARAASLATLVVLTTACASSGGRVAPVPTQQAPTAAEAASPLEGEWRLASFRLADGSTRRVSGFVRFDRFSNITLRAELAADDPAARPPRTVIADFTAKARVGAGELEYVGLSMGVGAERLTDDAVTMAEWRHFELAADTLRVFVRDRAGRPAATLVFERTR